MCRRFVVVGLGGGVVGRLFMSCRQLGDPCFHLSSFSLVGWEDGSHLHLGASGCQHLTLASIASVPTFRRLRVLLDASVVGSGDADELPLSPCSFGHSWPPFTQEIFIIIFKSCLLSLHQLTPSRLWW
jgi:hypothetical protein